MHSRFQIHQKIHPCYWFAPFRTRPTYDGCFLWGDDACSTVRFNAYLLLPSSLFVRFALAHTAALILYAYHYSMTNASAGEKIIKNAHPLWQPWKSLWPPPPPQPQPRQHLRFSCRGGRDIFLSVIATPGIWRERKSIVAESLGNDR